MAKFCTVKYVTNSISLEILCHQESVMDYRNGKKSLSQTVVMEEIYTNVSRGQKCNEATLKKALGDISFNEMIEMILNKGTFPLTTRERRLKVDQKKLQIVQYLKETYLNPKNNLPYTSDIWSSAIEEAKIKIDPFTPAHIQIKPYEKKLHEIIPLKRIINVESILTIPIANIGKVIGIIKKYSKVNSEKYLSKSVVLEIDATFQNHTFILSQLNAQLGSDYTCYQERAPLTKEEKNKDIQKKRKNGKGKNKSK